MDGYYLMSQSKQQTIARDFCSQSSEEEGARSILLIRGPSLNNAVAFDEDHSIRHTAIQYLQNWLWVRSASNSG